MRKTASAASVFPSDPLVWTIDSANAGPGPARNTVVTDGIPDGTTLVGVTTTQGSCHSAGQQVTCQIGTVPADQKATVVITARVAADRLAPLTNAAAAFSPDDADPSNNTAQVTTKVGAAADLSLTKTVTSGAATAGKHITWQLQATNSGPAAAPSVLITDPLPAGVIAVTVSKGCTVVGRTVTCRFDSLTAGSSLTATAPAPSTRPSGNPANFATVSSGVPDPDPSNNAASTSSAVGLDSRLTVTKTADRSTVAVDGVVSYTIRVQQNGTSTS